MTAEKQEDLIRLFLNSDINRIFLSSDFLREKIAEQHFVYVSSGEIMRIQKELRNEHRF